MSFLNNFAKGGGGCFLAGTLISTPYGQEKVENLTTGDEVYSYNEKTGEREISKVGRIDTFPRREYFNLNKTVNATREHPFYTVDGIKKVGDLVEGDVLYDEQHNKVVLTDIIKFVKKEEFAVYNLIEVLPNNNYFADDFLVHNKGGGGRSSGGHSSSSKSSSSPSKPSAPPKGTSTAKPGATVKTADGKTVKSSAAKPTNSKYNNAKGVVGDNGYAPKFKSGYIAPPGSVVYYPQHSALDYLPWIYLFSQSSPQHDKVTVMQPDGKQVEQAPAEGNDEMVVINWILLIIIVLAIIGGAVWGVNKLTDK